VAFPFALSLIIGMSIQSLKVHQKSQKQRRLGDVTKEKDILVRTIISFRKPTRLVL
jgi:hypothetical protein